MKTQVDYLIIGAGPAGLQLAYYLEKNNRDYLILERGSSPGTFFKTFPRHRMLISINKVNTGKTNPDVRMRYDWNSLLCDNEDLRFVHYSDKYFPSPDDLLRYMADFAGYYRLKIRYQTNVSRVQRDDQNFVVTDSENNQYTAKRLIVATGVSKQNIPNIPGIELIDTYGEHSLNLEEYKNKRVLIIGKGNSAFETAEYLTGSAAVIHMLSPHSIKFAWDTHFVGNLRAVNNNFLDTYQLKSQNAVIDATLDWVEKKGDHYLTHFSYSHAMGQTRVNEYDKIIACTGFRFDASIFDENCRPELMINDRFPAQTTEWESANVKNLYFAGTIMQACDYRRTMSGFIHGFRHNVYALSQILENKYHGKQYQAKIISADPESVLQHMLDRANHATGIFLQPSFLSEVVVINSDGTASCYSDLRKDNLHNTFLKDKEHYYTLTLEYGNSHGATFSTERDPDPMKGNEAFYLHPIIRRFNRMEKVTEHHIQDDLENEWVLDVYIKPAREFFNQQLSGNQDMAIDSAEKAVQLSQD